MITQAFISNHRVGILRRAIDAFKFERAAHLADGLADIIDSTCPILPAATAIVPLPTINRHIRQRGYDQVDLLCRQLALKRNMPIKRMLDRASSVVQHTALNKTTRAKQMAGAFKVRPGAVVDPAVIYLLVDDIVTTGSTVLAAAQALRLAGAKTIWLAALAYQPLD